MSLCIYCRQELNDNEPADSMTHSHEHIVPWALGGSNGFSTNEASKRYNNDLGRDVDAPLINLMPLAIKRHMLGIEGQSGSIPDIRWRARSMDNGEPATITITPDGKVDYAFVGVVAEDVKKKYTEKLVGGSPDRVRAVLAGMLAKAQKTGHTFYSMTGQKISARQDFEQYFTVEATDLFHARVQAFDFHVWVRGIFKMVLGLGHLVLGPQWTFSADGGDRIRSVLFCEPKDWPANSLKGFATGNIPDEMATILRITPQVRADNLHTLAILPGPQPTAIISLFGGDGIPEAIVTLGSELGNLAVVNESMRRDAKVGVRIDPRTRQTTWLTVGDLVF
jgi:hypothetical protein